MAENKATDSNSDKPKRSKYGTSKANPYRKSMTPEEKEAAKKEKSKLSVEYMNQKNGAGPEVQTSDKPVKHLYKGDHYYMTAKQKEFADEVIRNNYNQFQAAVKVGITGTRSKINSWARRVAALPEVERYLAAAGDDNAIKLNITTLRIAEELQKTAFSDIKHAVDPLSGTIINPHEMPEGESRAIKSYKIGRNGPEVTYYDKVDALHKLAAMLGFTDPKPKAEASVNITIEKQDLSEDDINKITDRLRNEL